MLPRQGVTPTLARFVATTKWEDIPEHVRHEAKRVKKTRDTIAA